MVNLCKIAYVRSQNQGRVSLLHNPSQSVRFACGENLEMEAVPVKVIPSYVDVGKVRTDLDLSIVVCPAPCSLSACFAICIFSQLPSCVAVASLVDYS